MTNLMGRCPVISLIVSKLILPMKKKNCGSSRGVTQNHVHILGGHLLVTRHHAGCIT